MSARSLASKGLKKVLRRVAGLGPEPDETAMRQFREEFDQFEKLSQGTTRFPLSWEDRRPCLTDRTADTDFDRHYIYHPAWAARILAQTRPADHVDISSILSFAANVSAFLPVRFYDYRPAKIALSGLEAGAADLTNLHFADESIASLSCMHVVEHIGLGRYGDPLDPEGDAKAMRELSRVLARGGSLLFAVPTGQPRVVFNAHRIYSYAQILAHFSGLQLKQFALVPDDPSAGGLIVDAPESLADAQMYGCGCYWFVKP